MSLQIVRRAIEKRLATLSPNISTAFENAPFTPVAATPYQRLNLLPNTPDNSIQGAGSYFERGLFQITLAYPNGTGPAASEAQAQLIRAHFRRGTSMLESGVTVIVTDTPRVSPAMIDGDRYTTPISIPYQAQITTP